MVRLFSGVYITNKILHASGRLEIPSLFSRVEKYLSKLEEKFRIFARPCKVLHMLRYLENMIVDDSYFLHLFEKLLYIFSIKILKSAVN